MRELKTKITMENALCSFIILCPILDMVSFIFRNAFHTYISPSTFLRPIITVAVAIAIFIKLKPKRENNNSGFNLYIVWYSSFNFIQYCKNRLFI